MTVLSRMRWLEGYTRFLMSGVVALFAAFFATAVAACPDWSQNGMQLNYTSDTLWTPRSHSVVAGGSDNLSNCPQPGTGYVATRPDFTLHFSGNQMGRDLEFRVQASCDTVLLVNDASAGWHFNDDSDGFNPRIRLSPAPDGIYDVWVGTYGPSTCSATLILETFAGSVTPPPPPPTAMCPDWSLGGQQLTYGAEALWTPRSFPVTAGGSVNLGACASVPGSGYVAQRPDFTLNFNENNAGRDLEFRVQANCDTVLLVNGADGQWHFVDDADGTLNPRLRLMRAAAGRYDIWVGTFGSSTCPATLVAETFGGGVTPPPPPPPPTAMCPDWSLGGQQLTYGAEALWTPRSFPVTAGGSVNLGACASVPGSGYVAQRPDFTLNFNENNAGRDLEFRVQANCDTVLLVNGADGQWHFVDDADGTLNPRLRLMRAAAGRYDIWVGTYGSSTCPATLVAETFGGGVTPPPPPPPPPPSVLPDPGNLTGYRGQVGQTLSFQVTGAASGSVWGSDIYTDDSSLARAAVHAGVLQVGQSGVVRVTILPGQQSYQGSTRNGVQTSNYGSWSGSYSFVQQGAGVGSHLFEVPMVNGVRVDWCESWATNCGQGGADNFCRSQGYQSASSWDREGGQRTLVLSGGQICEPGCDALRNVVCVGGGVTPPPPPSALPDPGNLTGYRGQVGQTLSFQVTGAASGSVWGSDVYTDDSSLARAAVHAGVLQVGQSGVVRVTILPGQQSYQGSTRNGVQTSNYGSWSGSYSFVQQGGGVSPQPGGGSAPVAAGVWNINANNSVGTLTLTWTGAGWSGILRLYGGEEPLEGVSIDPASGQVQFTRPIPGATQIYRGTLSGGQMGGQFNQAGGEYVYQWSATRETAPEASSPAAGGGAPSK